MYKKIDLDKVIIYDIETMINCSVFNFLDYKTNSKKSFVFFNDKEFENQPYELFKFLKSCVNNNYSLLGFNNVNFDGQVMHFFYDWCCDKDDKFYEFPIDYIIKSIYVEAQRLIALNDNIRHLNIINENKLFIPNIDLYKQQNFQNNAKRTSLKWLEFTMRMENIEEMPFKHDELITKDNVEDVVNYCWNDVIATHKFYNLTKFESEIRLELSNEFKLNLINNSEPAMVKNIFGKFLCEEMKITRKELNQLQTKRQNIIIKDLIFPYIKFQTDEFNNVLNKFKEKIVDNSEGSEDNFEYLFSYKGLDTYLGLGGIHACINKGVYNSDEEYDILDIDGTSYYPMLAIKNGIKPEHLGDAFLKVYPMMFEKRKQYGKKDPRNYIYKIILNSAYGLSNEKNSYLLDRNYTASICINGQLSLLMIMEALYLSIKDIQILQANTDGITIRYKKKDKETLDKIFKWWEETTKINLEYAEYSKMVINDVNNYLAVYKNGDIKRKGLFEYNLPLHKNHSSLVIPKAIEAFFIHNIKIEDYIQSNNNIYDFCYAFKKKSDFELYLVKNKGFAEFLEPQQKVCRVFVSKHNEAGSLMKYYFDKRKIGILTKKLVQPLDNIKIEEASHYNIDYKHYIIETRKIINSISPPVTNQTLF